MPWLLFYIIIESPFVWLWQEIGRPHFFGKWLFSLLIKWTLVSDKNVILQFQKWPLIKFHEGACDDYHTNEEYKATPRYYVSS